MKRLLSLILSIMILAASLASCAVAPTASTLNSNIRLTSSDAESAAAWLTERLGDKLTDRVVLGTSADGYALDLSTLENDGYFIRSLGGEVALFARTPDGLDRAVRKYAKMAETGTVADVTYHEGPRIKSLSFGGVGVAEFSISLPAEPSGNMTSAATELARLIKLATGVELSVGTDVDSAHVIRFEPSSDAALGNYGYEYEIANGSLYIRGAGKYGAANAVRRFLENELDWRGLSFGEAELMPADALDVPDGTKKREKPAFSFLNMYSNSHGKYNNPVNPSNSYGDITNAHHGMFNNNFAFYDDSSQICYTSEDRYEEVHENVVEYIDAKLAAGYVVGDNFLDVDIAQHDSPTYCSCKNCKKVFGEEGGNSGAVVRFANRLSEEINEVDYSFSTPLWFKIFAYLGTNAPPKKTAPNDYICVTFCTDFNCSNHALDGSECDGTTSSGKNNRLYAEWLEGWCAICDKMYVWDYALDSGLAQYTVTDTIYKDFRYLAKLGVIGIFWQCQVYGLGIQRVEHQLLWQLNWNMDMTEDEFEEYLCDILRREYGDGWKFIREYLDIWNAEQNAVGCFVCWGWGNHMFSFDKRFLEQSVADHFDECCSLFDSAIASANCREQELRLKALSCHMIYEGCYSAYRLALESGDEARQAELAARYDTMIARLAECGFNVHSIMTVDGARNDYEETLLDEFAHYWAGSIDGQSHGPYPWYEAYFKEYGGK